jgi:hypothetical protein
MYSQQVVSKGEAIGVFQAAAEEDAAPTPSQAGTKKRVLTERKLSTPPQGRGLLPKTAYDRPDPPPAEHQLDPAVWRSGVLGSRPAPPLPTKPEEYGLGRLLTQPAVMGAAEERPFSFHFSAFHQTGREDLACLQGATEGRYVLFTLITETHTVRATISREEAGVGSNRFTHKPGTLGVNVVVNMQGVGFKVRRRGTRVIGAGSTNREMGGSKKPHTMVTQPADATSRGRGSS